MQTMIWYIIGGFLILAVGWAIGSSVGFVDGQAEARRKLEDKIATMDSETVAKFWVQCKVKAREMGPSNYA